MLTTIMTITFHWHPTPQTAGQTFGPCPLSHSIKTTSAQEMKANFCRFLRCFPRRMVVAVLFFCAAASSLFAGERLTLNFNPDWKFIKDDPPGAQAPDFNNRG